MCIHLSPRRALLQGHAKGEVYHIGVGFCVARSTVMGNAKASSCGTSNGTATHAFFACKSYFHFFLFGRYENTYTTMSKFSPKTNTFFHILALPVGNKFFIFIFLLHLLSSLVYLHFQYSPLTTTGIILLPAFIAYCESCIYCLIQSEMTRKYYTGALVVLHNILAIVEYFLLINFRMTISQDTIDIIGDTNPVESVNFIDTYINTVTILMYVGGCLTVNYILYNIANWLYKTRYQWIAFGMTSMGFLMMLYCTYGFTKYRNGMGIPQMSSITRSAYAIFLTYKKIKQNALLVLTCEKLKVEQNVKKQPTVIVIIGESYSVYHSSLYGYKKETNPLLQKWVASGNLYLFDNVVTITPFTTGAMYADFSLDSLGVDFVDKALFPACFKKAGYYTAMYDNQYFVGQGLSFICDKRLSNTLFDYRNDERYTYDDDMVKSAKTNDKPSMYIFHLWGQHYTYKDRYPEKFAKYTANDYDKKWSDEQRETIANYDNATLYNDYVVNAILEKFQNDYCYAFYFSDHGEEVYELRNYIGHGSADHSPNPNYQLRVPLMVWLSPSFKAANQQITQRLSDAKHYPICTDDIGHSIINMAGIACKDFAPTRSIINDKFNKIRHRIVINSVDYDKELVNRK